MGKHPLPNPSPVEGEGLNPHDHATATPLSPRGRGAGGEGADDGVSELPTGWARVDFDESIDVVSNHGLRIKQKDYLPSGKLPVVDQGEGLIGGYTDELDAQVTAKPPVIVFGDHTRRFKFVKFPFAVGADGVKLFSPTPIWNPDFLFLQLGTIDLENRGYGRHYQHLRKESLVLAPAAEQTRIVEKLEELLSDLDAGVAELKAAQKKLGQYRQSLLKSAVEGALTAEWREARRNSPSPQPLSRQGRGAMATDVLNDTGMLTPLPPRGGGVG